MKNKNQNPKLKILRNPRSVIPAKAGIQYIKVVDSDFRQNDKRSGFTLPELLVAMGLFLIVVTIATGAFVQSLRTQRAAIELIAVNDNANIILEQVAREVRTGTGFSSPNTSELRFTNYLGEAVVYRHGAEAGTVERSVGGISFEPLTASNVDVKRLLFRTAGTGGADKLQPRVTISIGVSGRSQSLRDVITDMQTTISPRLIDS